MYMYEELTAKIRPCERKKMQFILIGKLDNISIKLGLVAVEFYLYPTVGTVLIHSAKPELTE